MIAHPLKCRLPKTQTTGQRAFPEIELVIVEIVTQDGLTGWGECLGRTGSVAYAAIVEKLLAPLLIGQDCRDIAGLHAKMRRVLTGRSGGMLLEAIAGVDIALWDIAGKRAGAPVYRLLGGMARPRVAAYASSINWTDDAGAAEETEAAIALGFKTIKVKIGAPVARAKARIAQFAKVANGRAQMFVDSNWAYTVEEACEVAFALRDNGFLWFEEPIVPEDIDGYRRLRKLGACPLAAGESDFTVWQAHDLIAERLVDLIQPDVARAGGITETRRIAELAFAHHVGYAPHVGWSGAVCAAASLHLAAAMPAFRIFECMVFDNPLRDELTTPLVGDRRSLVDGALDVPQTPGLGIEVDRKVLDRFRAT
ncbi:MAG: mandelate racemase/muconate lactonizing enzyme family protein [Tagaea sp.]